MDSIFLAESFNTIIVPKLVQWIPNYLPFLLLPYLKLNLNLNVKSSPWPEDLPFYRSPISPLPHFTPATQASLFFAHTKHRSTLGLWTCCFLCLKFFTWLASSLYLILFSISSLKNRLPNTSYLKRYSLSFSIPFLFALLFFSALTYIWSCVDLHGSLINSMWA